MGSPDSNALPWRLGPESWPNRAEPTRPENRPSENLIPMSHVGVRRCAWDALASRFSACTLLHRAGGPASSSTYSVLHAVCVDVGHARICTRFSKGPISSKGGGGHYPLHFPSVECGDKRARRARGTTGAHRPARHARSTARSGNHGHGRGRRLGRAHRGAPRTAHCGARHDHVTPDVTRRHANTG